jgi:uncharacterized membrane protein YtjA (UPF0391 family)
MLGWALRFFIAAALVMVLAHGDIGEGAAMILKILVAILLVLCSVSLVAALRRPLN